MAEFVKLLTCLVLVFYESGKDVDKYLGTLHTTVIVNYVDTIKICVPSLLYVVQNNLLYLSASHLDAATYQVNDLICRPASVRSKENQLTIMFRFALSHRSATS